MKVSYIFYEMELCVGRSVQVCVGLVNRPSARYWRTLGARVASVVAEGALRGRTCLRKAGDKLAVVKAPEHGEIAGECEGFLFSMRWSSRDRVGRGVELRVGLVYRPSARYRRALGARVASVVAEGLSEVGHTFVRNATSLRLSKHRNTER